MAARLQAIKNRSVKSQVFEAIRDAIFAGQLQPGDPLREMHLAKELGVSQVSVREALVELEHIGLVVRTPNIGSHVTRHSSQEVRERLVIRALLEGEAAVEAAKKMSNVHLSELKKRLEAISELIAANDYFAAAQADLQFHRFIWERSGNQTLYRMLDQLTVPLFAFASIMRSSGMENLKSTVKSHAVIVRALKRGDPPNIRAVIRGHIESSYDKFLTIRETSHSQQ
jgi:DNA-binding GntR family transcriptional regulator